MSNTETDAVKLVKLLASLKRRMRSFAVKLEQEWGVDAVYNELDVVQLDNCHSLEFCVELTKEAEEFVSWWFEINLDKNGWLIERTIMKNQDTLEEFPDVKCKTVDEMSRLSSKLIDELLSAQVIQSPPR